MNDILYIDVYITWWKMLAQLCIVYNCNHWIINSDINPKIHRRNTCMIDTFVNIKKYKTVAKGRFINW